ncbi:pentapeptide repeat-containing protein [Amycolatopsis sp. NPDC004169]|uniref:pentapeptide repeat-containing protein n=1 Tax=Amycolatopsis sp. NPDC004169 TaxID=3154453 RepID=UPI0033A93ADE
MPGRLDLDHRPLTGWFINVQFGGDTDFKEVTFSEDVRFVGCTLDGLPYAPPEWEPRSEYEDFD